MNKKKLVIIILAAVWVLAVIGWGIWQYSQPRFHDVFLELGADHVTVDQFLTIYGDADAAAFVTDLQSIDWKTVGTTQVTLKHGLKQETVALTIRDSLAPRVEFLEQLTEAIGYDPKPEDFVISAQDASSVTLSFKTPPETPADYSDVTVTVVVTDAYGNAVERQCILSYSWLRSHVTVELGQLLDKASVLMDSQKDGHLVEQEDLDAINAAGVGKYTITSQSGGKTATCVITVQDTKAPVVTVVELQRYQGDTAKAEEFVQSAEDPSGTVTIRFAREPDWNTLGKQTVTLLVTDPVGNSAEVEAALEILADTEAPAIQFRGTLTVGKNGEPDYLWDVSAYDNRDGECAVTVDASDVDLTQAGSYYVTYYAKDSAGNTAQKKRQVVVSPDKEDTAKLVAEVAAGLSDDPEAIRDFVREIKYTSNWGGDDPVWFGLTNKHGNCLVHNLTLKALLEEKGYETQLIWVEEQYDPHYWLIIKLDGKWKHIDGTPGPTHTRYSLMDDQQRLETLKGRKWDFSKWPACE